MGFEFLSAKAAQFTHGQDRAFASRLAGETLYSRVREVEKESFAALPVRGPKLPHSGDHVCVVRSGGSFVVERGNEQIGTVDDAVAERLHQFWASVPESGDMLEATVDEVSTVTGAFSVRLGIEPTE